MYLATAYPNSDLSVGQLVTIAVVMVGCLIFWLVGVYLADRSTRPGHHPAVAAPPDSMAAPADSTAAPADSMAMTGQNAVAGQNEESRAHGVAA